MMHSNKMVCCLKAQGKILREVVSNDETTVYLPFNQEYTILLKNLNAVRVQVKVFVDGVDATDGVHLIINGGQELDLQRYIQGGNREKGNKFKFIERTSKVEDHRGIKIEDGLIRVEYQFEKVTLQNDWVKEDSWVKSSPYIPQYVYPRPPVYYPPVYYPPVYYPPYYCLTSDNVGGSSMGGSSVGGSSMGGSSIGGSNAVSSGSIRCKSLLNYASVQSNAVPVPTIVTTTSCTVASANKPGITVPGAVSDQQFTEASWFNAENQKHSMVIKLLGETETGQVVQKPITVKAKPVCVTCGKANKALAKFCSECGTSLEIIGSQPAVEQHSKKFISGYKSGFAIGRAGNPHMIDDTKTDSWTVGFVRGHKDGYGKKRCLYK